MCSAPHVSAGVKIVLFFVFAALVRVVVWPDAICWTNDSGDVRRQVIVNDVTGENFVLETTLNKSSSAYRVPMQVCIRSDVSNLFCQSTSFVQDNLCFGFGRFFVVWIVQCLNGLALTAGYAFVLWKRSNGVITQVDLAIPIILLAFTLTVIWLHISLMSSWMFLWWRSGWVAPTIPYSEALVCGLCAVAILSEVFDLIVLCRAFRNKLTKQC